MNYNSLMNKPTINYRELIGDNTVSEVGGITEEQFNTLLNTDLSSYYTKAQIDDLFSRSYVYREKSGSIVTFDCPASVNGIDKVVSEIVAVQSGSGDPSPTNVRPISGWSAVNVTKCGKNLCKSTIHGYVSSTDKLIIIDNDTESAIFYAFEGKTYTISSSATMNKSRIALVGTDIVENYTPILQREILADNVNTWTATWTGWTVWYKCSSRQTAFDNSTQVELGSQATAYEPYNGTTYTTALKDGQGNPMTCYGGTLSNENGVQSLTLTHGYIASYNGETLPSTWISDRDVYAEGTTPTTGAEVVYALATSQQITQDTLSITSIAGINNIWCDSGDITVKALDRIIQG